MKRYLILGVLFAIVARLAGCSSGGNAGSVIIQSGFPPLARLYGLDTNHNPIYIVQLPGVIYVASEGIVIVKHVIPEQVEATIRVKPLESGGISVEDFLMVIDHLKVYRGGRFHAEEAGKLDAGEAISISDFYAILEKRSKWVW